MALSRLLYHLVGPDGDGAVLCLQPVGLVVDEHHDDYVRNDDDYVPALCGRGILAAVGGRSRDLLLVLLPASGRAIWLPRPDPKFGEGLIGQLDLESLQAFAEEPTFTAGGLFGLVHLLVAIAAADFSRVLRG